MALIRTSASSGSTTPTGFSSYTAEVSEAYSGTLTAAGNGVVIITTNSTLDRMNITKNGVTITDLIAFSDTRQSAIVVETGDVVAWDVQSGFSAKVSVGYFS